MKNMDEGQIRENEAVVMDESFDFNLWAQQTMSKSPWWAVSIAFHGLLALIVSMMYQPSTDMSAVVKAYSKPPEPPVEELEFTDPDFTPEPLEQEPEIEDDVVVNDDQNVEEESTSEDIFADSPLNNDAIFESIGVGGGSGIRGGKYKGRGKRGPRGNKGDNPLTNAAVLNALRWLARHQNADGSWSANGFASRCVGQAACSGPGYEDNDIGVTGLSLLAFLGAGYTPLSNDKLDNIVVGDVVKNCLKWLIKNQDPDGCFGRQAGKFMYNHCIAALAMAEAYGMTESVFLKDPAQRGIDFISRAQNPYLAWRYQVKPGDNDTSVTGWAVMAMKSAKMSKDLIVPQSSFDGAYAWLKEVTDETYYSVGYTAKGTGKVYVSGMNEAWSGHEAMTAVGMMCRIFIKYDRSDPALEGGAKLLVKDLPVYDLTKKSENPVDYYYWYYGSLALFQYDDEKGKYWVPWNKALQQALLPSQRTDKDGCASGSWDTEPDRWAFEGGRVYATAINALTMEIYYRYPPAFGLKGDSKDEEKK